MRKNDLGILLQGTVNNWTKKIVDEYQQNFPDSHILLSTWNTENIEDISCDVIKLEPPLYDPLHMNYQIVGAKEGLKRMNSKIIMKCRTDQFIHNKEIFQIFNNGCSKNKIMISNFPTFTNVDYWASDLCQIGHKETLLDFWNSIQLVDGIWNPIPEIYFTANYIIKGKKDLRPWSEIIKKYFYVKDYKNDFQIEWKTMTPEWNIKRFFDLFYTKCCLPDE